MSDVNESSANTLDGSCEYGGQQYDEGSLVCQAGKTMECRNGAWFPTGDDCDEKGVIE